MKSLLGIVPAVLLVAGNACGLAVFHLGNSLTDQAYGIVDIAVSKGYNHFFGRMTIPGAPIEWLADHECEGVLEPSGIGSCATQVLSARPWDAVVIQHRSRDSANDVEHSRLFFDAAYQGNPDCQAYFYQECVWREDGDVITRFENPNSTVERSKWNTRARARGITAAYPNRKSCLVVPFGEVIYTIYKGIKNGTSFPELTSDYNLLWDETGHLNAKGMYILATTHFATIYKADPAGATYTNLRYWKGPYSVSQAFAKATWKVVWDVVTHCPDAGVNGGTSAALHPVMENRPVAILSSLRQYSVSGRMLCGDVHAPGILLNLVPGTSRMQLRMK